MAEDFYTKDELSIGGKSRVHWKNIKYVPGGFADANFVFTQSLPSASWSVIHTLNKYPSVTVIDTGGNVAIGDVTYISNTELTITFSAPFSGKVYLN
jgi:hypothetical protein